MAIRTGSGGLKYPLPNQAQIQAQQAAAAASAGGSASASAYGANRRYAGLKKQLQYSAIESGLDRQFQAQQSYLDRGFRAEQAFFNREHEKGGQLESQRAAAERQAAQQGFSADQAQLDREFTTERDKTLFEREEERRKKQEGEGQLPEQVERDIDAGIEKDVRDGKLVLSPADQRELDSLEEARTAAGELDTEQQIEFTREYIKRRRAILRRATEPVDQAAQANQRQVFQDQETGEFFNEPAPGRVPGIVDQNGRFTPNVAPQGPDHKGQQKQRAEDEKQARDYMGQVNPATDKPYTREEAIAQVQADRAAFDEAFGTQSPDEEGAPAAPIGDTPLGMGESVQARSYLPPEGSPGETATASSAGIQYQGAERAPLPDEQVQSVANDVRTEMKDIPIDPKTETPALRQFMDENAENVARYFNTPVDQIPEEARPAVDFFNRYTASQMNKQPIVLRDPSEVQYLPSGTVFVDPNGQTRKVP